MACTDFLLEGCFTGGTQVTSDMCTFPRDQGDCEIRRIWLTFLSTAGYKSTLNITMCIWLRHFCSNSNILLSQHFQKTNCTTITPGSSMSLSKSLFQAAGLTWCQHTALGTKERFSSLPKDFCSSSQEQWEQPCPHSLRNRSVSPALPAQPESLPLCHCPSHTPSSWQPGEGHNINSARCKWQRILAYHVQGTPSPSSPNPLEIKELITLCLPIVWWIFCWCEIKQSQNKQNARAPSVPLAAQLLPLRDSTSPASLSKPNLLNKELLTTPHSGQPPSASLQGSISLPAV